MKTIKNIYLFIGAAILAGVVGLVLSTLKYPLGAMLSLAIGFMILALPFIFSKPTIGVFLIGFFLPFERVPTVEIGSATLKINHLLIILTLISCLVAVLAGKIKIPRDPIRTTVVLFLLALLVSLPVATNMSRALQVYVFMILMGAIYFVVSLLVTNKESLRLAVIGVLWGSLIAGIFALVQFGGDMIGLPNEITLLKKGYDSSTFGFARVQAFSQEPLYFANYIFIPIILLFMLNVKGVIKGVFNRNLSFVLLVVLLIDFILTVSRGAYLAGGAILLVIIITQAKAVINLKTVIVTLTVVFFVATGAYLALSRSESRALDEFISHVAVEDRTEGESVVMRLSSAQRAWEIFIDKPVLGVGLGNFGPVVQGDPDEPSQEDGWSIVNNEYLEILAEGGLVAMLAFVILAIAILVRSIAAYFASKEIFTKTVILALLFAFIAILVQYATFSTLYIIHIWFLIGLLGASANIVLNKNEQ